jgi:hypothetical protein
MDYKSLLLLLLLGATTSFQQPARTEVFRGRLELSGTCGQRVVSIISSNADDVSLVRKWKDPVTGKTLENVFAVQNYCDLDAYKPGDVFYFRFAKPSPGKVCTSCLMYRPVPNLNGFIRVVKDEQMMEEL